MFLALDAGGTSTRAAIVDVSGRLLGAGRSGGGNPTSAGVEGALAAIGSASAQAYAAASLVADPAPGLAVIAMAGEQRPAYVEALSARLAALGFGPAILHGDLLGTFHSGTPELDGYALIAGTGTVAARVVDGRIDRVVGGHGWLLGDAGGGYWIGHRVVQAVIAELDGQGPATVLTGAVLDALGIVPSSALARGRTQTMRELVTALYSRRPIELSRFAPLAFAAHEDPVARAILVAAASALGDLLAAIRPTDDGLPVVVGGSVVVSGLLAAPPSLQAALGWPGERIGLIPVADGLVGAAVLALREAGVTVDAALFARLQAEVGGAR